MITVQISHICSGCRAWCPTWTMVGKPPKKVGRGAIWSYAQTKFRNRCDDCGHTMVGEAILIEKVLVDVKDVS